MPEILSPESEMQPMLTLPTLEARLPKQNTLPSEQMADVELNNGEDIP